MTRHFLLFEKNRNTFQENPQVQKISAHHTVSATKAGVATILGVLSGTGR
jgi:hypothetical protein